MTKFALIDPTGIPTLLAETGGAAPAGALVLPATADLIELSRQQLIDGQWTPRPATLLTRSAEAPWTITLAEAPAAATVRIFDLDADELLFEGQASPGAVWTFSDPGRYAVEVDPPAPWLPTTLRLEVPA